MEFEYDVFISYSRKDYVDQNNVEIPGNAISKIKEHLKNAGISYWFDQEGITQGDQFAKVIVKNIKLSRILLFVSSEHSNRSEWACDEIATARTYKHKIIPFRIDDSEYNESVMLYLAKLDFVKYNTNPALALDKLVESIKKYKKDLDEQSRQKKAPASAQIEAVKAEVALLAKNAGKAIRIQLSVFDKICSKLKSVGITEKTCPVCHTPVLLEQRYCDCCGFYFPHFFGVSDTEKDVDPSYLAIMKGLWFSSSSDNKVEKSTIDLADVESKTPAKPKKEKGVYEVKEVRFRMIPVEGGSFAMNCNGGTRKVSLSSYKIGETPVTQELWNAVMGFNPSKFKGDQRPVEQVSWNDCQKFIQKLNEITNKEFRLPTEAEWEFAARGGNRSLKTKYSGSDQIDDVAWCSLNCSANEESNTNHGTHEVKAKMPNELRIYDMSGNVWEWCNDLFTEFPSQNETKDSFKVSGRVCRGGSWNSDSNCCEVSFRNYGGPYKRDFTYGLRLAL